MKNTYLAPVVKIQREHGQHAISTEPYAIIRHPYYAGAILLIIATPLMLRSWYGLAASAILAGALVFRIIMEERELGRSSKAMPNIYATCAVSPGAPDLVTRRYGTPLGFYLVHGCLSDDPVW